MNYFPLVICPMELSENFFKLIFLDGFVRGFLVVQQTGDDRVIFFFRFGDVVMHL